jgi:hypothetical protein
MREIGGDEVEQPRPARDWESVYKVIVGLGLSGLITLSIANNNATNDLSKAVNLNTYKLSQVQTSAAGVAVLQQQVAQLQFQVTNLEQRQAKDDAYREAHGGNL